LHTSEELRAVFDGRYVYFVPYDNGQYSRTFDGEVLRYDTTAAFDQPSSWATFDAGANGVGDDPDGYEPTFPRYRTTSSHAIGTTYSIQRRTASVAVNHAHLPAPTHKSCP